MKEKGAHWIHPKGKEKFPFSLNVIIFQVLWIVLMERASNELFYFSALS